jgi:hypothetical protein
VSSQTRSSGSGFAGKCALLNSAAALLIILAITPQSSQAAQASTTTKLVSSLNPSSYGQSIKFTATVSASKASGSITFNDGGTTLGSSTLTSGTATFTVSTLSIGSHTITAVYGGDSSFSGSTSANLTETVGPAVTIITLKSSTNPSTVGQSVTLSVTLSPSSATGNVTFNDGSSALGTSSVYLGMASIAVSTLNIGAHSITAVYSGDAANPGATSTALTQTVAQAKSTTVLTSSANPSGTGQSLTLTATITPAIATGKVTFNEGTTSLGSSGITAGVATLNVSTLAAGAHSLTAVYAGDSNDAGSTSAVLKQTINQGTTTALTSSTNPAGIGQPVTLTAAITPATASGGVTFLDGTASLGTATLSGGTATWSSSTLTAGTHSLTAVYGGDKNDAGSTSPVLTQTVTKAASTIALSSSANPSTAGQSITLTAAVSPATATGTVTFKDASNTLGTGSLSGGAATLSVSTLSIGAHSLTAVYAGDANDNGTTSSALTQTVNQAATTTSVSSSPNPSNFGQAITLTATVSPATATGNITFKDGPATLGMASLAGGSATFTSSNLASGAHSLTAIYSGDSSNASSTSSAVTQTVNQATTTTSLNSSANPSNFGQSLTLSASVSLSAATGSVTFKDGSTTLGSSTLKNGTATLTISGLATGSHLLTAVYNGDNNDASSTSLALTQTVNQATTTTTLNSTPNPSNFGQAMTLTATLSPSSATGSITFQDAGSTLGSSNINNGVATFTISALSTGAHPLAAIYGGDTNNMASTSATLTQTVRPSNTTTTLTSSANPSSYGQSVTLTVTLSPASATGSITFQDGTTALGSSNLGNGTATFTTASLASGPHSLTAVYSGDTNDAISTSTPLNQIVRPAATMTSLSVSPNPAPYGQTVTLTASISSGSGSITFLDGAATLGSATLNDSLATLIVSTFSVGNHTLTAVFSGDTNNASSTSAAVTQTMTQASPAATLTSAPNPSTPGQPVILTATVSSGSGTVTFKDGAASSGSAQLVNGAAALTLTNLTVGTHALTAVYGGDANNSAVTSPMLAQTVNPAATTTSLTSVPNPSAPGQRVTLTAVVSSGTGSVTFNDGSLALGTANLAGGTASVSVTTLSVGVHALSAVYSGDANNAASTSPVLTQFVNAAPTTTTLTSGPNPAAPGQNVTLAATVAPSTATGTVAFMDGGVALGASPIDNGTTALTIATLSSGIHTLTAVYSGDSNNATSTSAAFTQTVNGISAPSLCSPNFNYTVGQPAPTPIVCQFTAIAAAAFTVSTNAAWLRVTPSNGNLGQASSALIIAVDPSTLSPGTYSSSVVLSGPQIGSLIIPVQLVVAPPGMLLATPTAVSYTYRQGTPTPLTQTLTISSTNGTQLPFNIASDSAWLSASISTGSTPEPFSISVDPSSLDPNSYIGTLTISSPGLLPTQVVVYLTVNPPSAPQLRVPSSPVSLNVIQGGMPASVQLPVSNAGGGTLNFIATASGNSWLSVSPASATAAQPVVILCDPTSLDPGTYQGSITITSPDSSVTVPVTFSVAAPAPLIQLSQTGLTFRTTALGGAPFPQPIYVLNSGTGTLSWTASASTLSGGPWLLLPAPGTTTQLVSIDPAVAATLAPGDYYGQIQITASAVNSPQVATVILTILPPDVDPGPEIYPASLVFTDTTPQTVTIGIRKATGDQYVTGSTGTGFTWTPSNGSLLPNQPAGLQVTPVASGQGTISLQFSDGTVRTINVLSINSSGDCGRMNLQWRAPAQVYVTATQGAGYTLELQVTDGCGNPSATSVQATFSNGDGPVNLISLGNGTWTGTWQPSTPGTSTVIATAAGNALIGQSSPLFATILPGAAPIITPADVQQVASMAAGAPIAPGTLITLPDAIPPTRVLMGSEALPLLYTASGQVNVQVPFDAPVDTGFQLTVQQGAAQSLPTTLVITAAQPGIFTTDGTGTGQGAVYRSDGITLAQPGTSASGGEAITIYCTGLGTVTPAISAGTPPPAGQLSYTDNTVSVTIGGQDAQATTGVLVPGHPGIYQVSAVIPSGVSGDTVPVILTVAGAASPPVTMSVQQPGPRTPSATGSSSPQPAVAAPGSSARTISTRARTPPRPAPPESATNPLDFAASHEMPAAPCAPWPEAPTSVSTCREGKANTPTRDSLLPRAPARAFPRRSGAIVLSG